MVIPRAVRVRWPVTTEERIQEPCREETLKAESGVSGIRSRRGHVQREERDHCVEASLYSGGRTSDSCDACIL